MTSVETELLVSRLFLTEKTDRGSVRATAGACPGMTRSQSPDWLLLPGQKEEKQQVDHLFLWVTKVGVGSKFMDEGRCCEDKRGLNENMGERPSDSLFFLSLGPTEQWMMGGQFIYSMETTFVGLCCRLPVTVSVMVVGFCRVVQPSLPQRTDDVTMHLPMHRI